MLVKLILTKENKLPLEASTLLFLFMLAFTQMYYLTVLGLCVTLFFLIRFIWKLENRFFVKDLIISIAGLQWIIAAKISYILQEDNVRYAMCVDENTYMNLVVPGLICFAIGLYSVKNHFIFYTFSHKSLEVHLSQKKGILLLTFLGLFFYIYSIYFFFTGLNFIFILFSGLLHIGVLYLIFFYKKYAKIILLIYSIILGFQILKTGMVSDSIIYLLFVIIFYFKQINITTLGKCLVLGGMFLCLIIFQTIKSDYRKILYDISSPNTNYTEIIYDLFTDKFMPSNQKEEVDILFATSKEDAAGLNNRFNQGWIISEILCNIPKREPFREGETIVKAIKFVLMPRIFFPDKPTNKDQLKDFEEITNIRLVKNTSMGLSSIGEFYANYGYKGAWGCIFLYGILISLSIKVLNKVVLKNSFFAIFFLPLMIQMFVKSESNIALPLNYAFKTILFLLVIVRFLKLIDMDILNFNIKKHSDENEGKTVKYN